MGGDAELEQRFGTAAGGVGPAKHLDPGGRSRLHREQRRDPGIAIDRFRRQDKGRPSRTNAVRRYTVQ